jgi:hypothetical protein
LENRRKKSINKKKQQRKTRNFGLDSATHKLAIGVELKIEPEAAQ